MPADSFVRVDDGLVCLRASGITGDSDWREEISSKFRAFRLTTRMIHTSLKLSYIIGIFPSLSSLDSLQSRRAHLDL